MTAALVCALCLTADPVPAAPAPRAARPEVSLVVSELVSKPDGSSPYRVSRVGFRNGVMLPPVEVWEGEQGFLGHSGGHQIVADRYLVTQSGGVLDLDTGKVLHAERGGDFLAIDGTKVVYRVENTRREQGVFSFDLATGKVQKEAKLGEGRYALVGVRSPDGQKAIETGPVADELILHLAGAKPKSLGKGFRVEVGVLSSTFGPTPVLWLDDGKILTQRGNGKLVTVDLDGKVTELVTIKDAPTDLVSAPYFFRDGSGAIVYACGLGAHKIDVAKKAATKYEWRDLGHGFEAAWEPDDKFGHKLRHKGKEIGWFWCWPHSSKTAPGYLALKAQYGQERTFQPECVAVWTVARGEWETVKMYPNSVIGWVK